MFIIWLITIGWAVFNVMIGEKGSLVLGALPLLALLGFTTWRWSKKLGKQHEVLEKSGLAHGTGYDHSEKYTAIAINPELRTLTLGDGESVKTYAYEDVRSWEARSEKGALVYGGGMAGAAATLANAKRAQDNTGFFVTVRDIDNPIWRIAMKNDKDQARWMELLRQQINDR